MIKVYSAPGCHYCDLLKNFLKEKSIDFEEINIAENQEAAEEMVKKTGQMGVPVTEINGEMLIGFDKEKLEEILIDYIA